MASSDEEAEDWGSWESSGDDDSKPLVRPFASANERRAHMAQYPETQSTDRNNGKDKPPRPTRGPKMLWDYEPLAHEVRDASGDQPMGTFLPAAGGGRAFLPDHSDPSPHAGTATPECPASLVALVEAWGRAIRSCFPFGGPRGDAAHRAAGYTPLGGGHKTKPS